MRILFTCNEFPPYPHGGLGTFVKEMAEKLAILNHKVIVYGIYKNIEKRTIENRDGITIIRDPYKSTSILKQLKDYGNNVDDLCAKYNVDIVEAHDTGGFFMFIKFKKLFIRLHNTERYFKKRGFITVSIEKLAFATRKATIIGVSDFIISKFKKHFKIIHPKSSIYRIYNGISLTPNYDNIATKEKKIVYAGTIKPIKGINNLIDAFVKSGLYNVGYVLEIYGNDTIYDGKSYINQLLLSNQNVSKLVKERKIIYYGAIDKQELLRKFSTAELCVFPSIAESFGLVVIEAMNQGAIVIYTNQGAAKEIVNDGKDAFLVEPNNSNKMADKMKYVINLDNKEKIAIRQNAILKSSNFSMEKCVENTLKLYKNE